MADPWLTIIGLSEDGLPGLTSASREALAAAETIFGGPRHLAHLNRDRLSNRSTPAPATGLLRPNPRPGQNPHLPAPQQKNAHHG